MRRIVVVVALGLCVACGRRPRGDVTAIPKPPLERFDPKIREQIGEAQAALERELANPAATPGTRAAGWGDLGNTFHAYELVAAARDCYATAGALAPDDPRWPYFRGRLERSFGDPDAAIRELRRAIALDPRQVPARVALGEILLERAQSGAAEPVLREALELSPACAPAAVGLAKVALEAGRVAEARDLLLGALAAQPAADSIHHHLARVYRRLGEADRAEDHLRRAGARQPTVADPLLEKVELRRLGTHNLMTTAQRATRAGRYDEAIGIYRRVLATDPSHRRAWTNLGTALARQGKLAEAQEALERALALDPSDPLARFDLGTVLLRRGDPRAAAELEASLAVSPRQPAARFNLATAYRLAGRHEAALAQYDALVELASANPTARYWRALTRLRLGRPRDARADLEEGLRLAPGTLLLESTLARLLATSRDPEVRDGARALDLARRALAAPPAWESRRTLAQALAETGAFAAAVDEQARALAEARQLGAPAELLASLEAEGREYAAGRPIRLDGWQPVGGPGATGADGAPDAR